MSWLRHKGSAAFVHPTDRVAGAPFLAICLAAWLLGLALGPAHAQAAMAGLPAAAAAATTPPAAPALTQAEARQMMDLLNDPQKRAAFTATLQTLAKASAVAAPPKPATPVPLAPDSVGAELLSEASTWVSGLSAQMVSFGRLLGNLPAVWAFTRHTVEDPQQRQAAFDAAWHLVAVLLVAGLAEWGTRRLLRRPMRTIAAGAPQNGEPHDHPPAPHGKRDAEAARIHAQVLEREGLDMEADSAEPPHVAISEALADSPVSDLPPSEREDAAVEHVLRHRRFARMVRTLKRLPFVLLCFVLDLMPLGVFVAVGYAGTILPAPRVRDMLLAAITAYAVCRAATAVTRMFVAPEQPSLRLVHVSDQGAAYVLVWVRRIFAVAAFGWAATQIGQMFGLPPIANGAFLKTIALLDHMFLVIMVLQCRASIAERIRSHKENPNFGSRVRNRLASIWHLVAIFYIVGLWMVWAAEVRNGYLRIWHIFLVTAGVLIVARLATIVVQGGLDRAFRVSPEWKHRYPGLEQRANRYYPLLRGTVTGVLVVVTGVALLQVWGVNTLTWFRANALGGRLISASVTILVAAVLGVAVWEGVNASMDRHLARMTREAQLVKSARLRTLQPMLRTVLLSTLVCVFGLTALSEVGVNIAPLLAGAGILGVAIGFGSQKLVQDFITGIFLLLENAMQVGDWVTVAGLSGSVENLSIRTMRLRAGDGSVHIIPFSSVSTVTNVNRGIGNAAVTVNVPIEEDTDHVGDVLSEIARDMRGEKRFADMMRSDLQLWGVDKVDAGVVTIAGQIVCTDSGRWGVQREFNRRMNMKFRELGIRVASPVQTVYNHVAQEEAKPDVPPADRAPPANQMQESPPPAALGNTS